MSQRDAERYFERLIESEISRRRLLRQGAAGALSVSALAWLAACGDDDDDGGGGGTADEKAAIPKGEISKNLAFSNWPYYMDEERETLANFKKEYGTTVKYTEEINDNVEFFGKVRQQLERGDAGGRDIFVVTDWLAGRMIQLGYVQKLDKSALPNVAKNLLPSLQKPSFDENRDYSVPWQSGMTGLAYRRDLVGGDLSSVNDIFDPKFKGKTTMLTEMRDTVGLVMAGEGNDPEKADLDAMLAAVEKIDKAAKDGQIRRFTGNDYTKDLLKGDAVVSFSWSGDAVQMTADNENIRWIAPDEGFHLWTDNMQIPVGAPNAYTAEVFMDYVYRPEVQAKIAAYVNYVTPVAGVKEVLAEEDPELAENQFIFPDEETLSKAFIFRLLDDEEDNELNEAFQQAVGA